MPTRILHPLLFWIAKATNKPMAHALHYLQTENEILRSQQSRQVRTTLAQRRRLLKAAKPLGRDISKIITIVAYTTFLRWRRDEKGTRRRATKSGRPMTPDDKRELVLRLAHENGWGYSRIHGELKKLKVKGVSRTTIRNILIEGGLDPAPQRAKGSWVDFMKRHTETLWACDFISKKIITKSGLLDCFVLFYIHVASRRVELAGVTVNPNAEWVAQQARNFAMDHESDAKNPIYLIRDRDGKFTPQFDYILRSRGVEVKKLPARSPNLNAFSERWVQSLRIECLDHFIVFGDQHMRHIVETYVDFYNQYRPHQSLANEPLAASAPLSPPAAGPPSEPQAHLEAQDIACQEWLGGLLRHYYRRTA